MLQLKKADKTVSLCVLFLICQNYIFPQKINFADYNQNIAGSELQIEMVAIPAGEFTMGSPVEEMGRKEDEGPVHKVQIDAFWMSKYEITWALYNLFVERTIEGVKDPDKATDVQREPDAVSGATIPYVDMSLGMGTGEGFPVGNVTSLAASQFCKWLSAKTGNFYRLPTEAEWEYAARAGTITAFFFGDNVEDLKEYAWYNENSNGSYHKIGQKKPNPWGLYDIYGNVAEWTLDQYLPKGYAQRKNISRNPYNVPKEEYPRSVRGGSYRDEALFLRSAARSGSTENWKMRDPQFPKSKWWNTDAPFVGFRIVSPKNPPNKDIYEILWSSRDLDN